LSHQGGQSHYVGSSRKKSKIDEELPRLVDILRGVINYNLVCPSDKRMSALDILKKFGDYKYILKNVNGYYQTKIKEEEEENVT